MRLDKYLFDNGYFQSRTKAVEAIERGQVFINGMVADKPSTDIKIDDQVTVKSICSIFVSLGGDKLERAIHVFQPQIENKIFIDVGASTGGFTDCLLQNGAKKVYCVDVGENLLADSIASDSRVIVMDNTNARYLTKSDFCEQADGIVVDCSFISLEYILPGLPQLLKADGYILALIKPQFETRGRIKMKNGILKDQKARKSIVEGIYNFVTGMGLSFKDICSATIDEKKNKEYIAYISKTGKSKPFAEICDKI